MNRCLFSSQSTEWRTPLKEYEIVESFTLIHVEQEDD